MDHTWLSAADMLHLAQELGRMAVFERNLRTGEARWSPQMFALFGFEPSETAPPAQEAIARVHPDDREEALSVWSRVSRVPGRHEHRYRLVRPDGEVREIHGLSEVRCGADGLPELMLGVNIDDTEVVRRMQAQAHRIDLITQAAGVGVWTIDIAADEMEWNDQMFHIYGLPVSPQAPSLRYLMEHVVHPADRAMVAQEREHAAQAGREGVQFEFRIMRPDDTVRWVSSWSRREKAPDGRLMAYGVTVDVTERQEALAQLRAMDELARLAAESAGIGVWERDSRTRQSRWGAQMYRLRGVSPESGMTAEELRRATHHPEDAPELDAKFSHAELNGVDYEHEFRVIWPDGSVHWLATRGVVKRDEHGKTVGMTGVNWDITERKRAEQALRDKVSAEQASQAKSEFLSRIGHDIKAPLDAVLGGARKLLQEAQHSLTAAQFEQLRHIEAAGGHLSSLMDGVLELAAVESSRLALDIRPVDLQAAIDEVLSSTRAEAERSGVTVHVQPVRAWVLADAGRLRQILSELLGNAIKYNLPQGQVWLSAQPYPVQGADGWQLRVRDSGRGMSAQQLEQLFVPFRQFGAQGQEAAGKGVGLAIVRNLVDRMAGSIEARSTLGSGSEFRLGLRACSPPPQPDETDVT